MRYNLQPAVLAAAISIGLIAAGILIGIVWARVTHARIRPTRWAAGACVIGMVGTAYYVGTIEGIEIGLLILIFGVTVPLLAFFMGD